ncbi:MAG TPA: hypothetical protein VFZ12_07700 [Dehalococcoidia bacterium]|nr:hypothetical protein [Dehalococcoidia bacterium]
MAKDDLSGTGGEWELGARREPAMTMEAMKAPRPGGRACLVRMVVAGLQLGRLARHRHPSRNNVIHMAQLCGDTEQQE